MSITGVGPKQKWNKTKTLTVEKERMVWNVHSILRDMYSVMYLLYVPNI